MEAFVKSSHCLILSMLFTDRFQVTLLGTKHLLMNSSVFGNGVPLILALFSPERALQLGFTGPMLRGSRR